MNKTQAGMNYDDFVSSLSQQEPPKGISLLLAALWHDGKNDWETSHHIAQDISGKNGSWIHAYLHRKEGDIFNARYWYNQAGKPEPSVSLEKEWELLVKAFL